MMLVPDFRRRRFCSSRRSAGGSDRCRRRCACGLAACGPSSGSAVFRSISPSPFSRLRSCLRSWRALAGTTDSYWFFWRVWFLSEAVAYLTLAPAVLTCLAVARLGAFKSAAARAGLKRGDGRNLACRQYPGLQWAGPGRRPCRSPRLSALAVAPLGCRAVWSHRRQRVSRSSPACPSPA